MGRNVRLAAVFSFGLMVGAEGCGKTAPTEAAGGDGSPPSEPARTYVGKLAGGTDTARIGLATSGTSLLAYVCSGDEGFNGKDCRWFTGKLVDGKGEVALEKGPKLTVTVKGDAAEGSVTTSGGKALTFKAPTVPADGPAGVYQIAYPNGNTLGWIVDDSGFVGGVERKGKDGGALAAFKFQPGVKLTADDLKGMIALSYHEGTITSTDIRRVTTP
jgi:hypothetical protein